MAIILMKLKIVSKTSYFHQTPAFKDYYEQNFGFVEVHRSDSQSYKMTVEERLQQRLPEEVTREEVHEHHYFQIPAKCHH